MSDNDTRHTSEERANLLHQYRRILEEINHLRRERLQNELSGNSTSRHPPVSLPEVHSIVSRSRATGTK